MTGAAGHVGPPTGKRPPSAAARRDAAGASAAATAPRSPAASPGATVTTDLAGGDLARRATADPLFRLVAHALEAAHGRPPAAVWSAPYAFHLGSPAWYVSGMASATRCGPGSRTGHGNGRP